jgi:TolA-binding protein
MVGRAATTAATALIALCVSTVPAWGLALDEMVVERWAKLREAERYQLNIAEKFYRDHDYKAALTEYQKFIELYEKSEGAPFAQMKWGICQVQLRKPNTAIKDGFKTVIDYWPESPEAVSSSYYIGRCFKDMGESKSAKKAYTTVLEKHPKQLVAVLSRVDLLAIARGENDYERAVALLRDLTFDTDRKGEAGQYCQTASRELAWHNFYAGNFAEGLKAFATSYREEDIPAYLRDYHHGRLLNITQELTAQKEAEPKQRGTKLAEDAANWLKSKVPEPKDDGAKAKAKQLLLQAAEVYAHARVLDKQKDIYDQMLKTYGPDDAILGQLAGWYKASNRRDEARKIYLQFKDQAEGQGQVAYSFREEQKWDPAVDIYRKLAVQDVKNAPRWLSEAAITYRHGGKPDQAIAVYRELMVADANHATAYHWEMAETLYQAHRWKEAITAFRGSDRYPDNFNRMAHCNRQLKQYTEAITLYRQIVATHPPSAPWALIQVGYTLEESGQKEPAIKTFQTVCDRFPKSNYASEAHVHLNNKYKITYTKGGEKAE